MDLKPQNKKERIALWFIFILPLIVYWLVLWNNKVTQRYLASLELTEEWKKEIERLNAEYYCSTLIKNVSYFHGANNIR